MIFKTLFTIGLLLISNLSGAEYCFIAVNEATEQIVLSEGTGANLRISPASTFKIPLSIMGFDAGILIDEDHPEWPDLGYDCFLESQKGPKTPKTWMKYSAVWYSQVLAPQIGMDRIVHYLAQFEYGNEDMRGDAGQDNGITNAWLCSSLKISPLEQISFLKRLVREELPVSSHALQKTRNILFLEELTDGWKLFGKTGTGWELQNDGTPDRKRRLGWLVGWVEKDTQCYLFALNLRELDAVPSPAERREMVKKFLSEGGLIGQSSIN